MNENRENTRTGLGRLAHEVCVLVAIPRPMCGIGFAELLYC